MVCTLLNIKFKRWGSKNMAYLGKYNGRIKKLPKHTFSPHHGSYRKFDGKWYSIASFAVNKKHAKERTVFWKNKGFSVRVIPALDSDPKGVRYRIYKRK